MVYLLFRLLHLYTKSPVLYNNISMNTNFSPDRRGFTLIELLIVISIVSILSGLLLTVLKPGDFLAKGRDVRRTEDLNTLFKALTLAQADGQITLTTTTSCTTCNSSSGTYLNNGTGYVKFSIPSGKTGLANFLQVLPLDPTNSGTSVYTYGSDGTNFELNAVLESTDNAAKMTTDGGNSATTYEIGTSLTIL